jgi:alkylation response protein AidB-like acyl-CoA dehydrogenase
MTQEDPTASARSDFEAWRRAARASWYDTDPFLQRVLRRRIGARYLDADARLRRVAEEAGPALADAVEESGRDENLPSLRRHDADGRPTEEVSFHPTYHTVGRAFWASGAMAVLAEPGSEVLCGSIAYLLDQHGEAGHSCPLACTAGAIKLIQRLGTEAQKKRYLPSLTETDYDRRLHAAQFVTEVQGGSDVGTNACRAAPAADRPGWHRIRGEKWFCSVADAGLFVVSARPEGAPAGTRGLGLFLVPRMLDGRPNGFTLRRLKRKLGTRSMATGEIEFDGALGEVIGPLGEGFKNLVAIVLDTSRVHNALAACGIMRRAVVEAHSFARNRRAFDRQIVDFPAVRETLAGMRLRAMASLATTFRILEMTDRIATGRGDGELAAARRIRVMINKHWTAVAATMTVRDGIEVLGGNGTIEDFSVLPRLYRDSIVLESWEGTHNALCAQVLRDFAKRGLHRPWLREIEGEIGSVAHRGLTDQVARARALQREVSERIERLLASDPETALADVRHVVGRMCRLTDWVELLSQAAWDLEHDAAEDTVDALELYRRRELEHADPQESPALAQLSDRFAGRLSGG